MLYRFIKKPIAYTGILLLVALNIGFGQGKIQSTELISSWSFEYPESIKADQADGLLVRGDVVFRDGLAGISDASELSSEIRLSEGHRITFWSRFMVDLPMEYDGPAFQMPVFSLGTIEVTADFRPGKDGKFIYSLLALGRQGRDLKSSVPGTDLNLTSGLWVQMAVIGPFLDSGKSLYKLYYRAEKSAKGINRNYWIYIGQIETEIASDPRMLLGGRGSNSSSGSRGILWMDEARLYKNFIDAEDLNDINPILSGFEQISKKPPGVVIDYSPAFTGRFVAGSPAILVLDDGTYLAKGDDYGPAVGDSELARIYRSEDRGKTWRQIAEFEGITWASLFSVGKDVYMLGTSAGHRKGHAIIVKSEDGGFTWSKATGPGNGVIFSDLSYHTAPGPVVIHDGKIWRAMEDEKGPGGWGTAFRAFLLHADIDSDLLNADSWHVSDAAPSDQGWLDGKFHGWLEGNAVLAPNNKVVNVLRVDVLDGGGKAAIISYDKEGVKSQFDPEKDIIDFPGGSTKFFIEYDEKSRRYWALSNAVLPKHNGQSYSEALIRNTLVLMSSADLRSWQIEDILLYHPDIIQHAFQYPAFDIDGEDMVFVSRTAYDDLYDGAFRQHDVNYFTFHRLKNFRDRATRKLEE